MTAGTGPLQGIRILDLSIAATGPLACSLLADQGAEVIKVERPGIGDIGRWVGVSVNGMSALYAACNRGKRCIAVDVQTDEGRDIVRRLAQDADVFVQNFRPGTLDRHGLGYDDLREGHDDLVYVSLSGFGATGPYAGKSAYDTVIQAYGGFGANQADPADGIPVFLRQTAADKVTAFTAAQAITAALLARERGHGGQHVELSMLDAVVSFLWADAAGNEVLMDSDGSRPSSFVATFRPFQFLDGFGIATPTSDHDFVGIMRAFDIEGAEDPRVATIAERNQHGDISSRDDEPVLRGRGDAHHRRSDGAAERAACAVRRGAVGGRARRRRARTGDRPVRGARPRRRRAVTAPPPPDPLRGDSGRARYRRARARRAHRRDPRRDRAGRPRRRLARRGVVA